MIVAFTGHRPQKLVRHLGPDFGPRLFGVLWLKLRELRPSLCVSGMALGVDQIAARACVTAKIPWIAAVPFAGQERRWPAEQQRRYRELLQKATEINYVSAPPWPDAPRTEIAALMHRRDRWMVDKCDHLLAVWDGSTGGTCVTVMYGQRVRRPIEVFDPSTWTWSCFR